MDQIIKAINRLRLTFINQNLQDKKVLAAVLLYISKDSILKDVPAIKAFTTDISSFVKGKTQLTRLKKHIDDRIDNFVFSAFNAPYFEELALDAFFYEPLAIPSFLYQKLKSPTLPVNILQATKGFNSRAVVALFPENHIDQIQLPENRIFYFIDKFVARFFKITKVLLAIVNKNQLLAVRQAVTVDIEQASIYWVCLHEYFHRQGHLPIPQYLDIKTTRALAGLEELRVDLLSIFFCLDNPQLVEKSTFVAEFILTERLLRYAVEGVFTPNYDAIASQLLFNYLVLHKAVTIAENDILTIEPIIYDKLRVFYKELDSIESLINFMDKKIVKSELLKFVNSNLRLESNENEYRHNAYFSRIKTKFGF